MVQLKKQPNRVLRRAWGSLVKKASNRTVCTADDLSDNGDSPPVSEKHQFRRALNSSWLAGPLAGATSVYKRAPQCFGMRVRDESTSAHGDGDVNDKKTEDKTAWIRGAGQLWSVDKFDHKNYR